MELFNRLPGFQTTPPGVERQILRRLPALWWKGTALGVLCAVVAQLWPWEGTAAEVFTRTTSVHIGIVSLLILHWTVVLTVAIGAFIVMVMKGPAYVADAYPLPEPEPPSPSQPSR